MRKMQIIEIKYAHTHRPTKSCPESHYGQDAVLGMSSCASLSPTNLVWTPYFWVKFSLVESPHAAILY